MGISHDVFIVYYSSFSSVAVSSILTRSPMLHLRTFAISIKFSRLGWVLFVTQRDMVAVSLPSNLHRSLLVIMRSAITTLILFRGLLSTLIKFNHIICCKNN